METIINHNWNPKETCQERFCDSPLTYFEVVEINKLKIIIGLCEKHKEVWEFNRVNRESHTTNRD